MKLLDGKGRVLTRAKIVLIFRGSGWNTFGETASTIEAGKVFSAVLASPFLSRLLQYRDIRRPEIVHTIIDTSDVGQLGPDPRGLVKDDVWVLSDENIRDIVKSAVKEYPPKAGQDTVYMVAYSQTHLPAFSDHINDPGFHNWFQLDSDKIIYGVGIDQSTAPDVNYWVPTTLTHEIIESCTDPEFDAFHFDVPIPGGDNEIADYNKSEKLPGGLPGVNPDLMLPWYWSELEKERVLPTSYSLRIALNLERSKSLSLKDEHTLPKSSIRDAVLARFNP